MSTPALLAALLAAAAISASAKPAIHGSLLKLRMTPAYERAVIAGAYKTAAWLADRCASAKAALGVDATVLSPPVVDDAKGPQSGSWIEHVVADGCGASRQLNVLVLVRQPNAVETIPLLPGSSRADPVLQKDGVRYAFAAAVVDPKGCKPVYVSQTEFVAPLEEPPLIPGKPGWSERWTVVQCAKRTSVDLRFMPDATGTTVTAQRSP